jgi:hypothetical protein
MEREIKLPIDFAKLLAPNGGYGNEIGRRVYGTLSQMAKTFITTNYDEWLDREILLANADPVKPGTAPATASESPPDRENTSAKDSGA